LVTQEGAPAILTVSANTLTLSALANNSSTFDINSNISWNVSSDQPWLTISKNSGSNNETITLTTLANTITSPRTALVSISGNGVTTKSILVTQEGGSTGIEDIPYGNISIFPNPVKDRLVVLVPNPISNTDITIISLTGECLFFAKITGTETEVDLSKLNSGFYLLKVILSDKSVLIKKIIKQ
jgi:hypothetical protein